MIWRWSGCGAHPLLQVEQGGAEGELLDLHREGTNHLNVVFFYA
jgi:hypothetical protein